MFTIKRTTFLPINCYYGILVLAKNEAVLILIPRYMVFFGILPNTKLMQSGTKTMGLRALL